MKRRQQQQLKTQPGTAASLKTRYQEKLMKPKREKAHTPKQNPEKRKKDFKKKEKERRQ
jgi:hypothetical protein